MAIILRVLRLEVSWYNFYIFKPLLAWGGVGGGGVNPLVEVTVNRKKENSSDFYPTYVQVFGLRNLQSYKEWGLFKVFVIIQLALY